METKYVSIEVALALHATIFGLTTGQGGVRDMGALLDSLERPKTSTEGTETFPTLFLKAAALIESIAQNHPFIDSNERTSYLVGAEFLATNGYDLAPAPGELVDFMLWIATKQPSLEEIAAWLEGCSTIKG